MDEFALDPATKVYVGGHRGMVGSAIVRQLQARGHRNIVTRTHAELDRIHQAAVNRFFAAKGPAMMVLPAAKVGGIHANNTFPADFIYQNLVLQANVIHAAHVHGVRRLRFLGSSCIYPRVAPQPMEEGALLTGKLEPTNEPYAIAKIAGTKMCESYNRQYGASHGTDYRSVMPTIPFNTDRVDHIYQDPHVDGRNFVLHYGEDQMIASDLVEAKRTALLKWHGYTVALSQERRTPPLRSARFVTSASASKTSFVLPPCLAFLPRLAIVLPTASAPVSGAPSPMAFSRKLKPEEKDTALRARDIRRTSLNDSSQTSKLTSATWA